VRSVPKRRSTTSFKYFENLRIRSDTAALIVLNWDDQREEVVQIMPDSYYGILEVVGR
jgi:glutamate synthase domain-containing protein 3